MGEAIEPAGGEDAGGNLREGNAMRLVRTMLVFVLPIAFGALLGKYGLGLDGSGTNFTW